MVFVAALRNACLRPKEAVCKTSEKWQGKSGVLPRSTRSPGDAAYVIGQRNNQECLTNSPIWEAVCLSSKCVKQHGTLNSH